MLVSSLRSAAGPPGPPRKLRRPKTYRGKIPQHRVGDLHPLVGRTRVAQAVHGSRRCAHIIRFGERAARVEAGSERSMYCQMI